MPSTHPVNPVSMSVDQLVEHSLALPTQDRELLLDRILARIDAEHEAEASEWSRRIEDIEAGDYVAYCPEEVEAFIRNRKKGS